MPRGPVVLFLDARNSIADKKNEINWLAKFIIIIIINHPPVGPATMRLSNSGYRIKGERSSQACSRIYHCSRLYLCILLLCKAHWQMKRWHYNGVVNLYRIYTRNKKSGDNQGAFYRCGLCAGHKVIQIIIIINTNLNVVALVCVYAQSYAQTDRR